MRNGKNKIQEERNWDQGDYETERWQNDEKERRGTGDQEYDDGQT
jgi:hypothetical protein